MTSSSPTQRLPHRLPPLKQDSDTVCYSRHQVALSLPAPLGFIFSRKADGDLDLYVSTSTYTKAATITISYSAERNCFRSHLNSPHLYTPSLPPSLPQGYGKFSWSSTIAPHTYVYLQCQDENLDVRLSPARDVDQANLASFPRFSQNLEDIKD